MHLSPVSWDTFVTEDSVWRKETVAALVEGWGRGQGGGLEQGKQMSNMDHRALAVGGRASPCSSSPLSPRGWEGGEGLQELPRSHNSEGQMWD